MELLKHFIQDSTVPDFALIALTISAGAILVLVGILMLILARRRKLFIAYIGISLLPIIFGIAGAGLRWYVSEFLHDWGSAADAAFIRQHLIQYYLINLLIGVFSASLPVLIGIAGFVFTRTPHRETHRHQNDGQTNQ